MLTILLGVFVLGERLRTAQWAAVGVAAVAIVVITVDYGRLPWIAIVLACSFATYGLLKKQVGGAPLETLAVETCVVAPLALIGLAVLANRSQLSITDHGVGHLLLLLGSGVVTAVPLLLFAAGARRIPLSVVGLIQYLTPVIQLAVGVGIRHEPMSPALLAGFCLVWVALIMLIADSAKAAYQRRTPKWSSPAL